MKVFSMTVCLVLSLLVSIESSAQTELPQGSGYGGLGLGYADPTNTSGRFGIGASVGLNFPHGLSSGLFFNSSNGNESGVDTQTMHYGVEAGYRFAMLGGAEPEAGFGNPATGFKLGAKIGMATIKVSGGGVDETDNVFTLGPSVAYDFPVAPQFTIGAQADLMFTFNEGGVSTPYVFAVGKYWF